jgi:hypothetical protein
MSKNENGGKSEFHTVERQKSLMQFRLHNKKYKTPVIVAEHKTYN